MKEGNQPKTTLVVEDDFPSQKERCYHVFKERIDFDS